MNTTTSHDKTATELLVAHNVQKMIAAAQENEGQVIKKIRKYAFVSTPRTGSSLLSEYLHKTGMGWPIEWINPLYIAAYKAIRKKENKVFSFDNYLKDVILGTYNKEHNIFGINFHVGHYWDQSLRKRNIMELGFDKIYAIHRKDKSEQAYSLAKAIKTDLWSSRAEKLNGQKNSGAVRITALQYLSAFTDIFQQLEIYDRNIKPSVSHEFYYEDLCCETGRNTILNTIQSDFGINNSLDTSYRPNLQKQRNQEDLKQLDRILAELSLSRKLQ